jgi:dipeptidyl aminopeptidase/acylaminoacyl peptidase
MGAAGLRLEAITTVRPAIKAEQMSTMMPVVYTARDGMKIHGYLTKPLGREKDRVPLLVMPHGGPFGIRDTWGFNPEVQFLASRGYAVLQPNFRGSGGYGWAFERAGFSEWGAKMQDDLTDGVKWAIAEGHTAADKVGIIGASYGGYAALAGATFTPDLYRVAVNYVGVSDLRLITRYDLIGGSVAGAWLQRAVGTDPAVLAARSPVEHVAKIQIPTMHAYGRNDPRVKFEHWEVLERELKKHGKVYSVLIENEEGHGFEKEETAFGYYGAVERFLAKHFPAE